MYGLHRVVREILEHRGDDLRRVLYQVLLRHAAAADSHLQGGARGHAEWCCVDRKLQLRDGVALLQYDRDRRLAPLLVKHIAQYFPHHLHDVAVAEEEVKSVGECCLCSVVGVVLSELFDPDHLGHSGHGVRFQEELLVLLLGRFRDEADFGFLVEHGVWQGDHVGPVFPLFRYVAERKHNLHRLGVRIKQLVCIGSLLRDNLQERTNRFLKRRLLHFRLAVFFPLHGCRVTVVNFEQQVHLPGLSKTNRT
mmetsp:Transcript_16737/g.47638  ORF Transcript_16737/g.47638 Transcript_16737/m.47638 type:complete len:251 (-) Transcript_16737:2-754(-)